MSKFLDSKLKIVILIAAILVVLITGFMLIYFNGIGAVDKNNEEPVSVNIPSGSGGSAIVELLDEAGLVKNKTFAKVHVRIGGYDSLQANSYVFSKSMTLPEMMDAINTGNFDYISKEKFTIIEGATIAMATEAMAKELPFTAEEIIAAWADTTYLQQLIDKYWFLTDEILAEGIMYPLEGYVYPETYFVTEEDPTIQSITEMILDKTDQELTQRRDDIEKMDLTVHEFLALASVVENESLFDKDRAKIAGVFLNRLEEGMALQSDITVLYALQERRVSVTNEDLQVESGYNTYQNTGLPIGPVCAVPGRTMDDVLNYEDNDYLFFFAMEDGSVIYSKTYEEHQKVVEENRWY
ncbi:MAG: endolytic transglycosylase MltG [Bacillota bacterium]|nr:endolytic transglycosylase MltG [Bacillota bacterium]